jgi:hypothetical protein
VFDVIGRFDRVKMARWLCTRNVVAALLNVTESKQAIKLRLENYSLVETPTHCTLKPQVRHSQTHGYICTLPDRPQSGGGG